MKNETKQNTSIRVIQTFWTAGQDPLKCNFGWRHAEYNLMSWALSCLCLRKLYKDVILYTDEEGKHILIDILNLPYTEVHIAYDKTLGLPQHWAQAKIKTYSMQTEPFLHIDGDVYLAKQLPETILNSPLIAQNREIGTSYYKSMMEQITSFHSIELPKFILESLNKDTLASYNMGIFGGRDLKFIHYVCSEAFKFITKNQLNNPMLPHSKVDCNILYEQIFFATLADKHGKKVASIYSKPVKDEGYKKEEFCDLMKFNEKSFFHILGGHKQSKATCEMLEKFLLSRYPEYYLKIFQLFPKFNSRLTLHQGFTESPLKIEKCIAKYEDFIINAEIEWRNIPFKSIINIEKEEGYAHEIIGKTDAKRLHLQLNPYQKLFVIPSNWPQKALDIVRERVSISPLMSKFWIGMIPQLGGNGVRDVGISILGVNIIKSLSETNLTMEEIIKKVSHSIEPQTLLQSDKKKLIMEEVEYLIYFGIVTTNRDKNFNSH